MPASRNLGDDYPASADQLAAQQTQMDALSSVVPQYVSASPMHQTDVRSTYPAGSTYRGKLARVDDLFGFLDGTLRCALDANSGQYFWLPSGTSEMRIPTPYSISSGDVTLTALGHPTMVSVSGTIGVGVTRKVILDATDGYPGAKKQIDTRGVTSLLGTLKILTGVTDLLSIALNSAYQVAWDYNGGSPRWVQI